MVVEHSRLSSLKWYGVVMFLLLCMVLLSHSMSTTQGASDALGDVINTSVSGDTLTLTIDNDASSSDDTLELTVLDENLFKVDYRPEGVSSSTSTPMIDPDKTWDTVGATIDTTGNPIVITTSKLEINIDRYPTRLTVKDDSGTPLLWEPSSGGVFHDGVKFVRDTSDNIYGIRSFSAQEDTAGLLRNDSNHPAHAGNQGDSGGPFMWSTAGYGVLVDSDGGYPYTSSSNGALEFYYGGTPVEGRRYHKDNVEYYVMVGEPRDIMSSYADITGEAPILPKWSLGFMHFEWGMNQAEMEGHIDNYRARNIPLDAYALDYDWQRYGEDNYGESSWNTDNFPDAANTDLKDAMDDIGIKLIGIRKPRIVTEDFDDQRTQQYYDAENGGYWYPDHFEYTDYFIPVTVRSIDPYQQAVRDWWWKNSEDAFDKGIIGWWNDETDKVDSWPADYWFGNFTTGHMSQAMYEGQRDYTNDEVRVWQTARTYYPGAQRYATTLWSGDIGIQYYKDERFPWAAGMQEQTEVMLSSANLGQPKWGMDVGGFNAIGGMTGDNPNPELYSRWMQFGAFTPVFRVHGNYQQQRQPWFYGTTAEELSKSALHIRYSLIPYMYAYEREAYETGLGLIKPLLFDYPDDANVADNSDAWMFGDWMLVSPVLGEGQSSHEIYLPEGTWIDYFRGHEYSGEQTISYPLNAETWTDIPVFVKKGAIIPTQDVQDHVGQEAVDVVYVDVFPDTNETSFIYYDDDGASYGYESGIYFKQELTTLDNGSQGINFGVGAASGSYTPEVEHYLVKIHDRAGTNVTLNQSSMTSYQDLNALKQATGEGWTTGRDIYGDVTYIKLAAGSTSAKDIVVTGNDSTNLTHFRYEAEEASLSGNTVATQASVNDNHSGYSGTGFVDSLDNDGAAVTFYANVQKGGDYDVNLRYANAMGTEQTMSIYVNSVRVKQTELPNLASWSTWDTVTETLPLTAGHNIITYKYEAEAGDTGNINIDFIEVPFEPNQAIYYAESAALSGGASTNQNHWFYTGDGFVDKIESVGAEVKYSVDVPTSGNYNVSMRYANGTGSNQTLSVYVNNSKDGQINLTSPASNWSTWDEHEQILSLDAGTNTITYRYDSGDSGTVNLDRLIVSSSTITTPVNELNLLDNGAFERNTSEDSNWFEWYPTGQASAFGIDRGSGSNPPESGYRADQRAWFFSESAYQQSLHQIIDVENNETYRMEARVRLANTTPFTARAEILDYGGSAIYENISNTGEWQYISIDNINVTNGQIDVGFYVDSPGYTTLQIDDVRIYQVD